MAVVELVTDIESEAVCEGVVVPLVVDVGDVVVDIVTFVRVPLGLGVSVLVGVSVSVVDCELVCV